MQSIMYVHGREIIHNYACTYVHGREILIGPMYNVLCTMSCIYVRTWYREIIISRPTIYTCTYVRTYIIIFIWVY